LIFEGLVILVLDTTTAINSYHDFIFSMARNIEDIKQIIIDMFHTFNRGALTDEEMMFLYMVKSGWI